MRRLADVPEHLDGDLGDVATLEGNLRDLSRINRAFGGARLSIEAIRCLVRDGGTPRPEVLRVLDVGTGAADIPAALTSADGPWGRLEVTAVDSRPEVVEAAMRLHPSRGPGSGITLSTADGRSLPYPEGSFDVAHASLLLHHLSSTDAVALLRELRRVSTVGVVVNDLARGWRFWLGAWLVLHGLTRNAWTLHDGPLSVRRAWTVPEARDLLREAGLRPVHTARGFAGHRWAIAAVPA